MGKPTGISTLGGSASPHSTGEGVTCALITVEPVDRTTTSTSRAFRHCALIVSGWGIRKESVPGVSLPNKGMSGRGTGLRWRQRAVVWSVGGRFGLTHTAGFRVPCTLVGACILEEWPLAVARDVRTHPYYTWASRIHEWSFLISCSLLTRWG